MVKSGEDGGKRWFDVGGTAWLPDVNDLFDSECSDYCRHTACGPVSEEQTDARMENGFK